MTEILTEEYVREAISNINFDFCCSQTHPGLTCNGMATMMILRGLKPVIKTYLPVHIVPFLLFKRKKFLKKYNTPYSVLSSNFSNCSWVSSGQCCLESDITLAISDGVVCSSARASIIIVSLSLYSGGQSGNGTGRMVSYLLDPWPTSRNCSFFRLQIHGDPL